MCGYVFFCVSDPGRICVAFALLCLSIDRQYVVIGTSEVQKAKTGSGPLRSVKENVQNKVNLKHLNSDCGKYRQGKIQSS